MIKIKLSRKIKGKHLTEEFEETYGSIDNLKEIFKNGKGNMKLEMDLEDWKYFLKHPKEEYDQEIIIYDEKPTFSATDLQILDIVKNEKPKSITELGILMGKDSGNIAKQVNKLKEKGFLEIKKGKINNIKTPIFNYDKIEIGIE